VDNRRPKSSRGASRGIRLGERDLELLWFLAEHRMALPDQVAALLGTSDEAAKARLARLANAGYVRSASVFRKQPMMHLIASDGLKVLASALPLPRLDMRTYQHDAGVAWLWLAARRGTFGPLREIVGERRMRSHDGAREPGTEPLAVRLGGVGARGGERLHYPDLLLRTTDGRRIALEFELSSKGPARLDKILAGYAADPRIDGVVYLVESWVVARSVKAAARRAGIASFVHIQRVRSTVADPAAAAGRAVIRAEPERPRARRAPHRPDARAPRASHPPDRGSEAAR
jgi:hypothetical protein